jgi:pantoate--beta-alanine ligase
MVRDLNLDIDVVGMPIVRESDGLAMSSRNAYLSASERASALCLSESISLAEQLVAGGERDAAVIIASVRAHITAQTLAEVDYVELVDAGNLRSLSGVMPAAALIALAVRFGPTRLIDNRVLHSSQPAASEANLVL